MQLLFQVGYPERPMSWSKYSRSKYLADLMANTDDGSETKTEVDNLNSKKCARKRQRRCLPPEIVFEILLYLPAHVIHDVMTHVYEEWNLMISTKNFTHDHFQNSTPGIIIMEETKPAKGIYVEIRRGCLEICKFDWNFYLCGSSVNGLVLVTSVKKGGDHKVLSIINPLTKQQEALPYDSRFGPKTTLAFAEASMKYKAVCSFGPKSPISVLTIGVDNAWRYIDVQHIPIPARKALLYCPYVTRGYVHWIGASSVLTLNVETEIIYEFARPAFSRCYTLAMGRNLSFYHLSKQPQSREYLMEVMEMNPETGEWKLLSSDLKPLSDRFKGLNSIKPFGVLAGGEVFLFGISGSEKFCAAYNVRTREIQSFQLEINASKCYGSAHMNTMIWYE